MLCRQVPSNRILCREDLVRLSLKLIRNNALVEQRLKTSDERIALGFRLEGQVKRAREQMFSPDDELPMA